MIEGKGWFCVCFNTSISFLEMHANRLTSDALFRDTIRNP
jgi:hypothetical protein